MQTSLRVHGLESDGFEATGDAVDNTAGDPVEYTAGTAEAVDELAGSYVPETDTVPNESAATGVSQMFSSSSGSTSTATI